MITFAESCYLLAVEIDCIFIFFLTAVLNCFSGQHLSISFHSLGKIFMCHSSSHGLLALLLIITVEIISPSFSGVHWLAFIHDHYILFPSFLQLFCILFHH
jgi:hypothetical protein